jgi:hypothetical protein
MLTATAGAQSRLDSLRIELAKAAHDSMRIAVRRALFRAHLRTAPDSALQHAEAVLQLLADAPPAKRA